MRIHAPVLSSVPCKSVLAFPLTAVDMSVDMNAAASFSGVLLDVAAAAAASAAAAADASFVFFFFGV